MPTDLIVDHRPRVAAERRERMRTRLLESALIVFARKGPAASVIQDVVAQAGVSQGTFYNYFRTQDELFDALAQTISCEVVRAIESVIDPLEDPALKIATAIRSFLHAVRECHIAAQFISSVGLRLINKLEFVRQVLTRDLALGREWGFFLSVSDGPAIDLIGGTVLMAVHRIAMGGQRADYPEAMTALVLMGLGMDADAARGLGNWVGEAQALGDVLLHQALPRAVGPAPRCG